MAASALLKNTLKKLFLAIKHSELQGKNVSRNNNFGSQSFLYFTKIFVLLLVVAPMLFHVTSCHFNVYKLIGWNPVNLFKVISRGTRKMCGIRPMITINTVECRSGVLFSTSSIFHKFLKSVSIVNFEQVNIFLV